MSWLLRDGHLEINSSRSYEQRDPMSGYTETVVEPVTIRLSLADVDRLRTYLTTYLPAHRDAWAATQRTQVENEIKTTEARLASLKKTRETLK